MYTLYRSINMYCILLMFGLTICSLILLVEEILHQLVGSLSHYLQGFIYGRWLFRISEPSTVIQAVCLRYVICVNRFDQLEKVAFLSWSQFFDIQETTETEKMSWKEQHHQTSEMTCNVYKVGPKKDQL